MRAAPRSGAQNHSSSATTMNTARTTPDGTKADPIVLDGEPEAEVEAEAEVKPPAKRGRFDVRDGTGGTVRIRTGNRFRPPGSLESVAESEAEEGSPSPDPTTESEHSQSSGSSVSSGPVDEPETLPVYEEDEEDSDSSETVCFQCGEPEGEGTTFQIERASGICDDCLQEDE